ncbi:MAG: hypothetical protein ACNS63_03760 [Candidatus Nitrospinota bacterium M3_3B_026]
MNLKVNEPPVCGHCGASMIKHDLPPVTFSDGLGWGAPFLWMCPNDECPIFRKGFYHTLDNYGQTTSMRAIVEPDSGRESVVPAFTIAAEHLDAFVEIRAEQARRLREEGPQNPPAADNDGEYPELDDYDPNKGFTEA